MRFSQDWPSTSPHPSRYWPTAAAADAAAATEGSGRSDGADCDSSGGTERCQWLFDIGEQAESDATESVNRYLSEPGVVAFLRAELDSWASSEVTCEEAETCGDPDPRALPALEEAGYYVPWLFDDDGGGGGGDDDDDDDDDDGAAAEGH
jgi:hypothetical protein